MATCEKGRGKLFPLAVFFVFAGTIHQQQLYIWVFELARLANIFVDFFLLDNNSQLDFKMFKHLGKVHFIWQGGGGGG